jgi:hypothetical protein
MIHRMFYLWKLPEQVMCTLASSTCNEHSYGEDPIGFSLYVPWGYEIGYPPFVSLLMLMSWAIISEIS